ncbi:unnamed protein product [Caenorhabditis sp. 36 PRJEB53466]|nr:unnamed protein product [Caenorhabditis sp. 36 PRJEB53466]
MPEIAPLTLLSAQKVAELIENDALPIKLCIKLSDKASNQVLAVFYDNYGDLNERTWKTIYLSGMFAPSVLDLGGVPIGWNELPACQSGTYTRFKLGHRHRTEREEEVVSEAALLFRVLNETSWDHLTGLDWSGRRRLKWYSAATMLSSFPSLTTLNVANQQVPSRAVPKIASNCPQLRHLNISETGIQNIGPLERLEHLEVLIMHNLDVESGVDALKSLRKLRVLDMSTSELTHTLPALFVVEQSRNGAAASPWRELRSIDIGGLEMSPEAMRTIIRAHPKLGEILILDNTASRVVMEQHHLWPGLQVLGEIDLLKRYLALDRPAFLLAILESMQNSTHLLTPEHRYDLLKISLKVSRKYAKVDEQLMEISSELTEQLWEDTSRKLSNAEFQRAVGMLLDIADQIERDQDTDQHIWPILACENVLERYADPVRLGRAALRILRESFATYMICNRIVLHLMRTMSSQQIKQLQVHVGHFRAMFSALEEFADLEMKPNVRCLVFLIEAVANADTSLVTAILAFGGLGRFAKVLVVCDSDQECEQAALRMTRQLFTRRFGKGEIPKLSDQLYHVLAKLMVRDISSHEGLSVSYMCVHTLLAASAFPRMWDSPHLINIADKAIVRLVANYPPSANIGIGCDELCRRIEWCLEERNFGSRLMFALWNVLMGLTTVPEFKEKYDASNVKQLVEEIACGIIELEGSEKIVKMAQSIVTFRDSNPSTYPSSI